MRRAPAVATHRLRLRPARLFVLLSVLILNASHVLAATFVVDSTVDAVDVSPGDGVCATAGGLCTFRAAVNEAASLGGDDDISVPAGTYTLTASAETSLPLEVGGRVSIIGAGPTATILTGPNPSFLHFFGVAGSVLENLAIRGWVSRAGSDGTLTFRNCAWSDGGIDPGSGNDLVIERCDLANFSFATGDGRLTVERSHVTESSLAVLDGDLTLTDSTVESSATILSHLGQFTCTYSSIRDADGDGVQLDNSSIIADTCSVTGSSGVGITFGGITIGNSIANSTISHNDGGGLVGSSSIASLTVVNSTISDNGGSGIDFPAKVTLRNSTIAGNSTPADGGGLRVSNTLTLERSIIAGNSAAGSGPDCVILQPSAGEIVSHGYNLIGDATDCTLTGDPTGNQIGVDPQLGPLADHGGLTFTRPLLVGSPAIDAGGTCALPTDQRGVSRPRGPACDIGAYEYATFLVNSTLDAADANLGDGMCATADGDCTLLAAITESNASGGGDVDLPPGTYVLAPPEGLAYANIDIDHAVSVHGTDAPSTIIQGLSLDARFSSNVLFERVTLADSRAMLHGGTDATLRVLDSIVGNTTILGSNVVHTVFERSSLSQVFVSLNDRSTVRLIDSHATGGGISGATKVAVTLERSVFENGDGIQFNVAGRATCTDSIIRGHNADGILVDGGSHLTATRCEFSDNAGAGVSVGDFVSRLSFSEGLITGNRSGGVECDGQFTTCTLSDSTVDGNTTTGNGGGIRVGRDSQLTLERVTISGNVAAGSGGGISSESFPGDSGCLSPQTSLTGVLLWGNAAGSAQGPDCDTSSCGALQSGGYNLIGDPANCALTGDVATNLIGVDPQLGPLQANGGPTFTRALLDDSPAIDTGGSCAPATDQRGMERPQGAACDIGAYESACGNGTVDLGETCASCPVDIDPPCPTPTATPLTTTPSPTSTPPPVETFTPAPTSTPAILPTSTATPETPSPTDAATGAPSATPTPDPICAPTPQAGCKVPSVAQKSTLTIKDRVLDRNDSLTWQWLKGSPTSKSEFGSPDIGTEYTLCIYDAGPPQHLVLSARVPSGQLCRARRPKPCWKATKSGFQYRDPNNTADGVHSVLLQEGAEPGKAKIVLTGKGVGLDVPTLLSLTPPLTVQFSNSEGHCWEATYSVPSNFAASTFKGKADPTPHPRPTRTPR